MSELNLELLEHIKRLAIIAMLSDDDLMETLIFKGGSAIDMIFKTSGRSSLDLDFSMESGLTTEQEKEIEEKIKITLETTFNENGFFVHDFKFEKRPMNLSEEVKDFWGGYQVLFKVISIEKAEKLNYETKGIRDYSIVVGKRGSPKFKIDISSYEYIATKQTVDFDDYLINVYTPEMIVFEKLRAICQQIPQYKEVVKAFTPKARGRDFYDIELLIEQFNIDAKTDKNKDLIANIFSAKKVPLDYINQIKEYREFHRENFDSALKDTVIDKEALKEFDYYFNYVLEKFEGIF